jgi:hypothetical protein
MARGIARGELPPSASPLLLTEVITAAVMGRILRGQEPPDEPFCKSVIELVLAGASELGVRASQARAS